MMQSSYKISMPEVTDAPRENSLQALWLHSLIQAKRQIIRWYTVPSTALQALLYPALTLVMFRIVLGDSVTNANKIIAGGQPSVYGYVAMIALVGAMSGSMVSALGLMAEKQSGLPSRFWAMPVHRASDLIGRMLAEALRVLLTTIAIVGVGVALGFRFMEGFLPSVMFFAVPVLYGMGFAVFVTALAARYADSRLIEGITLLTTLLMFFNSGFVPVLAYPEWLRGTVANQPMSCAIDAMKALSWGGDVATPLTKTLLWAAGFVIVFGVPAVRGYRRAAQG